MATNYEENTVGFGTLRPSIASIVDDLRAHVDIPLDEEHLGPIFEELRRHIIAIDIAFELDDAVPQDQFTKRWMESFYTLYHQFVVGRIHPKDHELLSVPDSIDAVILLCTQSPRCNWLHFDSSSSSSSVHSDVDECIYCESEECSCVYLGTDQPDVAAFIESLNLDESSEDTPPEEFFLPVFYQQEDPEEDLTEEGIEPNPGPAPWKDPSPRFNRYRGDATPTRRERRALKLELHLYSKLTSNSFSNRIKFSTLEGNYAQFGGTETITPLVSDPPPVECPRCGLKTCECMIKKLSATATSFSIAQSIFKIIDIIAGWVSPNVAQTGAFSWLFGTQPTLDNASTLLAEATERIQAIPSTESMSAFVTDKIREILDANCGFLPVSIRTILITLLTAIGLYIIYKTGLVAYEVLTLPLSYTFQTVQNGSLLYKVCVDAFGPPPSNIAQSAKEDILDILPKAAALAGTLMITYLTSIIPGRDNTMFGFVQKIGTIPRAASGFGEILSWCTTAVTTVWDLVRVKVLGYNPDLMTGAVPELANWMRDVEARMSTAFLCEACLDKDERYKALNLYTNGHLLLRRYHDALTPELKSAMQRMMVQAARIRTQVEIQYPEVKTIRTVPLPIWMVGESQIGKSTLQYLIATELCLSAGIKNPKDQMYMRCVEQDFWDGYLNQFVTLFDDFGQMKDTISAPNLEFFEIIRSVGPFPYPLHMADVTLKATTQFASKVIIASTNKLDLQIESLTFPDAVWNRLTQSWYIAVKPQYLVQDDNGNVLEPVKLNLSKVIEDSPVLNGKKWKVNPYIYDFIRFDARNDKKERQVLEKTRVGWDEFISILKDDLTQRTGRGEELDSFLADYVQAHKNKETEPTIETPNVAQGGKRLKVIPEIQIPFEQRDPIAESVESVFTAQNGVTKDYTLLDIRDFLQTTSVDMMTSTHDKEYFKMGLEFELQDCDHQPIKIRDHVPTQLPPGAWQELIIAFYRYKYAPASTIDTLIQRCSSLANLTYNRLPQFVRSFLEAMGPLVTALRKFLLNRNTVLISSLIFFISYAQRRAAPAFHIYQAQQKEFEKPDLEEPSVAESDTRLNQPRLRPHNRSAPATRSQAVAVHKAEMGQSHGQLDVIAKVRKQQYFLSMEMQDKEQIPLGTVTNIVGRLYMMPQHFLMAMQDRQPENVILANGNVVITKPYLTWLEDQKVVFRHDNGLTLDLVIVAFQEAHRGCNIINHFATLEDLELLRERKFQATISGIDIERGRAVSTSAGGECTLLAEDKIVKYEVEHEERIEEVQTYSVAIHRIPTKAGDCGKVISVNSDALSGRVFGIHIMGNATGHNHAQVISREEIQDAIGKFTNSAQCGNAFDNLHPSEDPFNTGVLHLGRADFTIPQATRSSIVKSRLYGKLIKPLTRPAALRPTMVTINDVTFLKDPLLEGAKKAGQECGCVPPDVLEMAEKDVQMLLSSSLVPDGPEVRLLTYEEAVKGIDGDELFAPINRTTSPGYPFNLIKKPPGYPGKTYFFGKHEWTLDTPAAMEVKEACDILERKFANCEPVSVLFIDTLKDERRPHAKVDEANTRLISNGPLDYNIIFRKYFMSALAHIRHNRIFNGIAIGMDVWSAEWHLLATHLLANSPHLIAGDFKFYDGSLMDQIMWSVCRIFSSMYRDGFDSIRQEIWHPACYACRYNQGEIYQCTHSLPTGFPATAECNSAYGLIVFRCAYILLARESGNHHLANMKDFNRCVRMITYGDDNLLSIKEEILPWFNMKTLVRALASLGMTYTNADKSTDYKDSLTIDQVSFLKRSFKKIETGHGTLPVYACPAPLDSRLDILNWTKYRKLGSDPEEADAVTAVLKELAMHGKDVYDTIGKTVVQEALDAGITKFAYEPLMSHLTKFMTGHHHSPSQFKIVPHQCDLTVIRKTPGAPKDRSTAIDGRSVAIQPYTLGSLAAAQQNPREHQSEDGSSGPSS